MSEAPPRGRGPLYEAVAVVLSCALQNDNIVLKLSDSHKTKLEVIEEYPMVLCEVIGAEEEALAERQLAATFLKNYLEELYTRKRENAAFFETDMGRNIALQLLQYLGNTNGKLRQMISYNLPLFLALGFWDTLTPQLNNMVKSDDPNSIHNVVFILVDAIDSNFFDSQPNYKVEEHWFNVLLDVFKMKDIPSSTRKLTIRPMFIMMKYVKRNTNYVEECWIRLSKEFENALNEPYSPSSDFEFKGEILKCLNGSTDEFVQYCNIFIPPSLAAIGNLLTICCEQYKKIVKGLEGPPKDASEENKCNPTNFYDLVTCILEFIYSLVDMRYFDVLIDDLDNLLYCIIVFMACHSNMDNFVFADLLEKDHYWTIREVCSQILIFILQKIGARRKNGKAMFFKSLHNTFQRLSHDIFATLPNNLGVMLYESRMLESIVYVFGLVKKEYSATNPEFLFPLEFYITQWTGMMHLYNFTKMIQGRILWMGGVYSSEIPAILAQVHLRAILRNLYDCDTYLLIPSVDALCNYLKIFKTAAEDKRLVITAMADEILAALLNVTRKAKECPLHRSLKALGYFVKAQGDIATLNLDTIEDILITMLANHFSDPFIMQEVNFVVAKLAQNQSFSIMIRDKFLGFLQQIVHSSLPKHMKNDRDKALDILNTYCLHSNTVEDSFIFPTFEGAMTLLNQNIDRDFDIDYSATKVLTTLVVKFPSRLKVMLLTPKGQPIIDSFPKLLQKMLEPEMKIRGNIFVKLAIATIFSLPELMEPHLDTILKNVITDCCKNPVNIRDTWIIFVFICMIRTTNALSYLSVLPGPHGGSALNFIMKRWVIEYIPELETTEKKIIVLSLTQIIQKCIESDSNIAKMEEVQIPFDPPNASSPTGEIFNGMEYMYYLLVEILLYEEKLRKVQPLPTHPNDFNDFGEGISEDREEEDDIYLFFYHPFNIDVVNHIVAFLRMPSRPYFSVVRRFVSSANYFILRDLGCNVPEINIHEDME